MSLVAKNFGYSYGLLNGELSETSGGLLIALPKESAVSFCEEIKTKENLDAFVIGDVIEGDKTVKIVDEPNIIEVPIQDSEDKLW